MCEIQRQRWQCLPSTPRPCSDVPALMSWKVSILSCYKAFLPSTVFAFLRFVGTENPSTWHYPRKILGPEITPLSLSRAILGFQSIHSPVLSAVCFFSLPFKRLKGIGIINNRKKRCNFSCFFFALKGQLLLQRHNPPKSKLTVIWAADIFLLGSKSGNSDEEGWMSKLQDDKGWLLDSLELKLLFPWPKMDEWWETASPWGHNTSWPIFTVCLRDLPGSALTWWMADVSLLLFWMLMFGSSRTKEGGGNPNPKSP